MHGICRVVIREVLAVCVWVCVCGGGGGEGGGMCCDCNFRVALLAFKAHQTNPKHTSKQSPAVLPLTHRRPLHHLKPRPPFSPPIFTPKHVESTTTRSTRGECHGSRRLDPGGSSGRERVKNRRGWGWGRGEGRRGTGVIAGTRTEAEEGGINANTSSPMFHNSSQKNVNNTGCFK